MVSARSRIKSRHFFKLEKLRDLFSGYMIAFAWGPTAVITVCHYLTGVEDHWLHDIYRRLYYIPIVVAALRGGFIGGITVSLTISLLYSPHAFFHLLSYDPSADIEKFLEIVIYNFVGGLCGILSDREEKRRRETTSAREREKETKIELMRSRRLAVLGELVAGIAHEIKNPIHTLKGTAEIVDSVIPQDQPQSEIWKTHKAELLRLEGVAEKFLSFARPGEPKFEQTDIKTLLQKTLKLLEVPARNEGITLDVRTDTLESDLCLKVDPDQILQVIVDIAINGFNAMKEMDSGSLIISAKRSDRNSTRMIAINLENNGPLIPKENLEKIFDPFFTTRKDGTGLGLSTAARIVEQHGGCIEAANTQNGVLFSVILPAV